jgi:hypothetical protein
MLPALTMRRPPAEWSNCRCVWPATTTGVSAVARMPASRSGAVNTVTRSSSLVGVAWQNNTSPMPSGARRTSGGSPSRKSRSARLIRVAVQASAIQSGWSSSSGGTVPS